MSGPRELLELYESRGGEDVYERARQLYEAALAATPDDPPLLCDHGYMLRHDEAIARSRALLAERPGDPVAHRCPATAHVAGRDDAHA